MPLLFPRPRVRGIEGDAIKPRGHGGFRAKPWNGVPNVRGNFLEKIILIVRREGVRANHFEKQSAMAGQPFIENTCLFRFFHQGVTFTQLVSTRYGFLTRLFAARRHGGRYRTL